MSTLVGDHDYQIQPTDRLIILSEPLSAPRTWALPQGGAFDADQLKIIDGRDGVSEENTLTITGPINGEAEYVINTPGAVVDFFVINPAVWKAQSVQQNAATLAGLKVRTLYFAFDTTDIAAGADLVIPAQDEMIVGLSGRIIDAWDSGTSDDLNLGVTGSLDAFVAAQNAQAPAELTVGSALGYTFDGEVALVAQVISDGTEPEEGFAVVTLITVPTED